MLLTWYWAPRPQKKKSGGPAASAANKAKEAAGVIKRPEPWAAALAELSGFVPAVGVGSGPPSAQRRSDCGWLHAPFTGSYLPAVVTTTWRARSKPAPWRVAAITRNC